jgi:phosphoglycolate phosphatase-like HAD superfamily hydrolase
MGSGTPDGVRCNAALVFDFDGTLVDSSNIKQRAFVAAISDAVSASESDIERAYCAHGTLNRVPQLFNAYRDLVGRDPDDRELETMVSNYGSFVLTRRSEVRLFNGMREFLAAHRLNFYLAVASNAPQAELLVACRGLEIAGYFTYVFGHPTSKVEAIEIVRRNLALPKSRILYIADRVEDGRVAEDAGVPFCRFGPNELEQGPGIVRTIFDLERTVAAILSTSSC